MANEYITSANGYVLLQKTAGTTGGTTNDPAAGTTWAFPTTRVVTANVLANMYPGVMNATLYPTVAYQGKKRPGVTLFMLCKPPKTAGGITYGLDSALLNSLLFNLSGTPARTDRFSILLNNGVQASRVWDWARCTHVVITAGGSGGAAVVQMGFLSRYGETEAPYGTLLPSGETYPAAPVWPTPTAANAAGELDDSIDYDWRSDSNKGVTATGAVWTASDVRGFTLHLLRAQNYVDYMDNAKNAKEIATGGLTGALTIDQNPVAASIPSTSANLRLHSNGSTNQGIAIATLLNKDHVEQPMEMGIETLSTTYTLIDLSAGGNPALCTAFTPA